MEINHAGEERGLSQGQSWLLNLAWIALFTFAQHRHILWLEWVLAIVGVIGIVRLVVLFVQK